MPLAGLPVLVNVIKMEKILVFQVCYFWFWLSAARGLSESVVVFLVNSPSYIEFSNVANCFLNPCELVESAGPYGKGFYCLSVCGEKDIRDASRLLILK